MIEAVIFDMDGVIIDSEILKVESWKRVLKDFDIKEGGEWYKKRMGISGKELSKIAIKEFELSISSAKFFKKNREYYFQILNEKKITPIKSSITFLKFLRKEGIKIGLASSEYNNIIKKHLNFLGIYNLFDAITSGANEIKKEKPNPEIYLKTAKKLKIHPKNCVAIEDSQTGIEAAKRAGMKCIAYKNPNNRNQNLSMANIVTEDFQNINLKALSLYY